MTSIKFKIISEGLAGAKAVFKFLQSFWEAKSANRDVALQTTIAGEAIPIDIDIKRSRGARVVDAFSGKPYVNFHGGFGSDPLGFNHPSYTREFKEAAGEVGVNKMAHADYRSLESNASARVIFEEYAAPNGFKSMYFTDGGSMANAEAVWAAIYTKNMQNLKRGKGVTADAVMALEGAFHGRNGTGASLTHGNAKIAGHPKITSFSHVKRPLKSSESIRESLRQIEDYCIKNPDKLAAFIVEDGIQCEAGDIHIAKAFYEGLRKLANQYGFFVIYDAVQTGFFSTGEDFAYKTIGAPAPDIITGSKKSRLGYVFAGERMMSIPGNAFVAPGVIDSTWFGHSVDYLMMASSLLIIKAENLHENAKVQGKNILAELKKLQAEFPEFIKDARGLGLTLTLEFHMPEACKHFIDQTFTEGVIVLGSRNPNVVRLRPNLAIREDEIKEGIDGLRRALQQMKMDGVKIQAKL